MRVQITIRATKELRWSDNTGAVIKIHPVGTILKASADAGHYWVTPMGGVYKDEAETVDEYSEIIP